jgi:hypothetical protein
MMMMMFWTMMILHPKAVAATWNIPNTERRPFAVVVVVVSMKDDHRPSRPCRRRLRRRRLERRRRRVSGVEVFPLSKALSVLVCFCWYRVFEIT